MVMEAGLAVTVEAGAVPGVVPGAGAYLEAHLAWSWVAWKTPSLL